MQFRSKSSHSNVRCGRNFGSVKIEPVGLSAFSGRILQLCARHCSLRLTYKLQIDKIPNLKHNRFRPSIGRSAVLFVFFHLRPYLSIYTICLKIVFGIFVYMRARKREKAGFGRKKAKIYIFPFMKSGDFFSQNV